MRAELEGPAEDALKSDGPQSSYALSSSTAAEITLLAQRRRSERWGARNPQFELYC